MRTIEAIETEIYEQRVIEKLSQLLSSRDVERSFHVFLSGGSTPKLVYRGLGEQGLNWKNVHFWWGDERFVPPDHPDSNFRMAKEQLLDKLNLSPVQIHPWPILSTPQLSADTYDRDFRGFFETKGHLLDLQLLGLGDDGHTASLFPNSEALENENQMCVANAVEGKDSLRLTLTYPALALSQKVIFIVKGQAKAEAVREVIESNLHPAAKVFGVQSTEFWLDSAAASELK